MKTSFGRLGIAYMIAGVIVIMGGISFAIGGLNG